MNTKGMFYTNVDDYKTKEDMMNDFIALRMYDMSKDKEIEKLTAESTEWESKCYEYQDEIEELKAEIKELNDDNVWWNNRFKAVQRDYEDYKTRIDKAIEYIHNNYPVCAGKDLLDILEGKE